MLAKIHHAAIDVKGGAEITTLLHDTTALPPHPEPPEPWFPESPPGTGSLLARAALHNMVQPFMVAAPLTRMVRKVAPVVLGTLREAWLHPERLPITRFNSEVSPHRVFESRRFTIDEFKRIRALVPGATINDSVLAVCGGALRRYLLTHDELPGPSLVSIAPVSIRNADSGTNGGRAASACCACRSAPSSRTRCGACARSISTRRTPTRFEQAVGAKELTDITKHAPAATLALSARLLAGSALGMGQRAPLASCTVTNVPGPAIPLYLNGARMTYFSAIMPISDGMGLVFAVTSYDGKIIISPTSCREQIPDPEFFALCIRESLPGVPGAREPQPAPAGRKAAREARRSAQGGQGQGAQEPAAAGPPERGRGRRQRQPAGAIAVRMWFASRS